MKKDLCSLVMVIVFCIIGSSVYGQDYLVLKYNFKDGKTFRSTISVNSNIVQSMMGEEMKIIADFESKSEIKFTKVDLGGNATALVSIINISAKTVRMGQEKEEKKSDFRKDGIRMVFAPSGKTVSVKSTDTNESSILREETISADIKFFFLPGRATKIGEKWSDKQIDTTKTKPSNPITFMTTTTENEYTLAGKEIKDGKELYKVSYTGTLEIAGKGKQEGMDLFIEGTGQTIGFFYFDPTISMVIYSESETEMNTTIALTGQENMTVPMIQKIKTVTTLEETSAADYFQPSQLHIRFLSPKPLSTRATCGQNLLSFIHSRG
ncbi:MAG: hypothetical protein WC833_02765 [Bacteroidales bacterium]